jgi:hypothetical protein
LGLATAESIFGLDSLSYNLNKYSLGFFCIAKREEYLLSITYFVPLSNSESKSKLQKCKLQQKILQHKNYFGLKVFNLTQFHLTSLLKMKDIP